MNILNHKVIQRMKKEIDEKSYEFNLPNQYFSSEKQAPDHPPTYVIVNFRTPFCVCIKFEAKFTTIKNNFKLLEESSSNL